MVLKKRFVEACLQALDYLIDEVGEVGLLVGYVDCVEKYEGKGKSHSDALERCEEKGACSTVQ